MKQLYIIFFILTFFNVSAQQKYRGCIIDVGTTLSVPNMRIQAMPSQSFTQSDDKGQFSINFLSDQELIDDDAYIINNTVNWKSEDIQMMRIYNLQSVLVYQKDTRGLKYSHIPVLPNAYYLLSLYGDEGSNNFLVYSNGEKILKRGKTKLNSFCKTPDTALFFENENYFSLKKSLSDLQNEDTIYVLKAQYESLTHFHQLLSYDAYRMLSNTPSVTNYGNAREIKVIHNLITDEIYYVNIKDHRSHYTFAKNHLGYELGPHEFLYSQFSNSPSRFLNNISILYHKNIDKYVLEFSSIDETDCDGIKRTFDKVLETSYFENKLVFYANNTKWEDCENLPKITSEELYLGQQYQALNIEENYGYLIKTDIDQLKQTYLGRHHIVMLNGIPNDLPVVAGIITTEFQTPLSHINILSHSRNTPNMALKEAWSDQHLNALMDQLVYLKVESDTFSIRSASLEEARNLLEH